MSNQISDSLKSDVDVHAASIVVRLFKGGVNQDSFQINLGDLQECDFPGYSSVKGIDFGQTWENSDLIGEVLSVPISFERNAGGNPQHAVALGVLYEPPNQPVKILHLEIMRRPVVFRHEGDRHEVCVRIERFADPAA